MTINLSLQRLQDAWRESEHHDVQLGKPLSNNKPTWAKLNKPNNL
jgi:hypothetical protein